MMSCIDVMYQSAYQPYQHYPFYQRHFTQVSLFEMGCGLWEVYVCIFDLYYW